MKADVVVVGAGVAGLAAALAVAPYVGSIILVERDELPDQPQARRGVPHSDQLHNLLGRGQRHLEALVPGFVAQVVGLGGVTSGVGTDTTITDFGRRLPRRDVGVRIVSAPRPVLEHVLRRALATRANVRTVAGRRVDGIGPVAEGRSCVRLDDGRRIEGGLVVDATGSAQPPWRLDRSACRRRLDRWYVSIELSRPRGGGFAMCLPSAASKAGALLSPVAPDGWHLSVSGVDPDPPPRTMAGLRAHLDSLADPYIARTLDGADGRTALRLFRRPQAVWYSPPEIDDPTTPGVVEIGDAHVLLAPLMGLGLSVAAWQAAALGAAVQAGPDLASAAAQYRRKASLIAGQAWELSALTDRPLTAKLVACGVAPEDAGPAVARLVDADPGFHRLDTLLWHLLVPSAAVTTPAQLDAALDLVREG